MARIAGINIPMNKHVWVGLTHIYGVGNARAKAACDRPSRVRKAATSIASGTDTW